MVLVTLAALAAEPTCPPEPPRRAVAEGFERVLERRGHRCVWSDGVLYREQHRVDGLLQGLSWEWTPGGGTVTAEYAAGELHGDWTRRDAAGHVVAHGTYVLGIQDGPWQESGCAAGVYDAGLRHGAWAFGCPGTTRTETTFDHGVRTGIEREWTADGTAVRFETFDDDARRGMAWYRNADGTIERGELDGSRRVGEWTKSDATRLHARGSYDDEGQKHGPWTELEFSTGIVNERTYVHGALGGPYRVLRADGVVEEGTLIANTWDGVRKVYNGAVVTLEATYVVGVLQGPYVERTPAGEVYTSGSYSAGIKTGPWIEGFERGEYDHGVRDGTWTYEDPGSGHSESTYVQGALDGPQRTWDPITGALVADCPMKDNLSHGVCRTFSPDGTPVSEETWTYGARSGPYRLFDGAGRVLEAGAYELDVLDGPWVSFYPDGSVAAAGLYVDGAQTGEWVTRHSTGTIASRGSYDAYGNLTGTWTEYYPDGTRATEGSWRAGMQVGRWTSWFPSGALHQTGEYVDGAPHGDWSVYWDNGIPRRRGRYDVGSRMGVWTFTMRTGAPDRTSDYVSWVVRTSPGRRPETLDLDPTPEDADGVFPAYVYGGAYGSGIASLLGRLGYVE